ncbi:hypothetical protein HETIRDRAFT_114783 [Heterobasidion irregulare TC 32-1]|uniref:Uncharacterized protein n=1 Tax=Heterobasidion irregulare (strain TC 32-1) TaxID=747525 RepID=W4KLY6_HETIT|nr:uncharacterized protein HETIRDRAFT_114783 [Heterobasidion irregulare TC 32-1]ETW86380.1 hypothetical protein HETIRDRAFT_114783 [Heterobasidion irregulare TC 32-1]
MNISLDKAELLALFLETFVYVTNSQPLLIVFPLIALTGDIAQAPEDAFILSIVPKTYAAYTITTVAITVYCTDTNGDRRRRMHSSIWFQHQTDRGDGSGIEWDVTEDEEWGRSIHNNGEAAMRSRVGVRPA